jgi:DNA-binding response OmpR family regulator
MKILLVEDNKKLSDTIKEGLEQEGFAVDCLYDGATAERRISVNRDEYDLVILDRMLPEKEGVEVCLAWRRADIVVPVLMLTALGTTDDKVFGLDAGADDYLAKPFEFDELIARIHALLRRPKGLSNDIITVSDITMDVIGRKVKFKSKDLPLTLKEFMVLEYLMRNVGKVITRDTLYSHAWDFADSAFSNTIDVHIKNLRKKLHDNGKFIQTVRGVGYKMEV